MFNDELILIGVTYGQDDIGNQEETETRRAVLCNVESVGRSEFYAAATSDVNPEIVFKVNKYEYQNERFCEFEGERFRIIRAYSTKNEFEEVELTCEKVKRNG